MGCDPILKNHYALSDLAYSAGADVTGGTITSISRSLPSTLRITVAIGTAGKMYLRDAAATPVNLILNTNVALVADCLYTLLVGSMNGKVWQPRFENSCTIRYLQVDEVIAAVL